MSESTARSSISSGAWGVVVVEEELEEVRSLRVRSFFFFPLLLADCLTSGEDEREGAWIARLGRVEVGVADCESSEVCACVGGALRDLCADAGGDTMIQSSSSDGVGLSDVARCDCDCGAGELRGEEESGEERSSD